jgi:hypothetical protein
VRHAEVATYERQGWIAVADLGPVHGRWSVLMLWTGKDEPDAKAEAADEEPRHARA